MIKRLRNSQKNPGSYFHIFLKKSSSLCDLNITLILNSYCSVILNMEKRWPTENCPETYYHEGFNHSVNLWRYWMEKEPEDYFSLYNNGDGKPFIAFELVKKVNCIQQVLVFSISDDFCGLRNHHHHFSRSLLNIG